ncbi:hypothetical protein HanIR_Chr02g0086721 [Helianthus annuus]|nr:hypothetical protein HanIR_Chr02g0086721 [Helianthus annuus]
MRSTRQHGRSSTYRRPPKLTIKLHPFFGIKFMKLFFKARGNGEYRDKDSISSKWTDINHKCHQFQEVFQCTSDHWGSGENDANILTRALEEYNQTRDVFTHT